MKKYFIYFVLFVCLMLPSCIGNGLPAVDTDGAGSLGDTDTDNSSETAVETTGQAQEEVPPMPEPYAEQFSPGREGIYNYCPSIMQLSDGTRYIYYCTNQKPFEITDFIGCRKGTPNADGSYTWGEELTVFSPSESGWDSHHTCDPSVIAGEFTYGGEKYGYLMAYLGCTSYDSQDNKVGLAVAKSPEGPFIRVGDAPFVDFTMDPAFTGFQWGVGQPSLINLDKKGNVLLFYTRGDKDGTRLIAEGWELSDLDAPVQSFGEKVSATGLRDLNGNLDIINNADLVYDARNKIFYAVSDCHPNPSDEPNYISSHFRVTSFKEKNSFKTVSWKTLAAFSPADTGAARNHNAGILRDEYGHLVQHSYLTLYYTVSETGSTSLWSYRIHDAYFELK